MRFSLFLELPFELNKGMKWTFFFSIFLLIFFMGQLSAQTNGCPWAGEDKTICFGECVIIGCEFNESNSDVCPTWEPTTFISEGYPPHSAVIEVCPTETTTYTIYITNAEGDLVDTDEVTVFVEPSRLEMSSDPYTICPGEVMTLTATLENGNPASYLWSTGETSPSIDVSPEFGANYKVTVTDASTGCVLENNIWARVYLMDDIEIYAVFSSICEQQDIGFTNPNDGSRFAPPADCNHSSTMLFTDSNPNNTYLWNTGETTFFKYAHTVGNHSVTVTNPDGCERTASYEVTSCDAVDINPDIMVNTNGENVTILNAGEGYVSYEWSDGSTGQTLEIDSPGDYSVTVVNEEGCVSRADESVQSCDDFAALLILYILEQENGSFIRHIYISNSNQFEQEMMTYGDRNQIENFIQENGRLLGEIGVVGYNNIPNVFHWVCDESAGNCIVESNEDHRIVLNSELDLRFSALILGKDGDGINVIKYYCLSTSNMNEIYSSKLDINKPGFSEPIASQQITAQNNQRSFNEINSNNLASIINARLSIFLKNMNTGTLEMLDYSVDMTVKFILPEDPIEYIITHNGEAVTEPIAANEGTQLVFGVARVDEETGDLIAVNNIGEEGVTTLKWNQFRSNSMEGVTTYIYTVPQFEEEGGTDILTLGVNFNANLEATIIPINVPAVPGFHHDDTPNASMTAPKSMMTLMDYVECARMTIETYDNENSDYDLYSTIFGEDSDLSVNIHLYSSNTDPRSGSSSIILRDATKGLLVLNESSINAPPFRDCPTITDPNNLLLKKISSEEVDLIREAIEDMTGEIETPQVVYRINEYNSTVGVLLLEWCDYGSDQAGQVSGSVSALLSLREELLYIPTESELDEWIQIPESADVYLNYEKLNFVPDYGKLVINVPNILRPQEYIDMDVWYNDNGQNVNQYISNYAHSNNENTTCQFEKDLDKFRCLEYTNVLAHELGHIKHGLVDKKNKYIWKLILNKYGSSHYRKDIDDNPCLPARVGNSDYCSRGRGHELGNPDNFTSCESVIGAWKRAMNVITHFQ